MATTSKLGLVKAERELLKKVLKELCEDTLREITFWSKPERNAAQSILDKIDRHELVKPKEDAPGLGWENAARAMRFVLGPALATPPNPDPAWRGKMSGRIKSLGLTVADCQKIARVLSQRGWRSYSFEKAIWEADRLLAEHDIPNSGMKIPKTGTPVEVDDT